MLYRYAILGNKYPTTVSISKRTSPALIVSVVQRERWVLKTIGEDSKGNNSGGKKMSKQKIVSTIVVALALAISTAMAENQEPKAAAGFSKIELGSSGGFVGGGTGKAMTVDCNGKIVTKNKGMRHRGQPKEVKQKEENLKDEELEQLKKLIGAVDWNGAKTMYNAGADMFMSDVTVTSGGKTIRTSVSNPRPKDVPKDLVALIDYLNSLYNSYKP